MLRRNLLIVLLPALSIWAAPACLAAQDAAEPSDLLAGAAWRYSTDGGKTFSEKPPTIPAEQVVEVAVKAEFTVDAPSKYVVLELTRNMSLSGETLNGQEIKGPLARMRYSTIPAIDAKLLKKGKNILAA